MAIFGPKPWVNPFGKLSIIRPFKLLVFIALKAFFCSRISLRIFSWPISPQKKSLKKWPFLDQNQRLTPLEKCQFFDFLNISFFSLNRRFFVLEYRKAYFPSLYCLKKESWKNGNFWTKTMG